MNNPWLDSLLSLAGFRRHATSDVVRQQVAAAAAPTTSLYMPQQMEPAPSRPLWIVTTPRGWYLEQDPERAARAKEEGGLVEQTLQDGAFHVVTPDDSPELLLHTLAVRQDLERVNDLGAAAGEGLRAIHGGEVVPFPEALLTWGAPSYDELAAHHLDAPRTARRKNRILLIVHGTFSNTAYLLQYFKFGQGDGLQLLIDLQEEYRAIVGFTHRTRSVAPDVNGALLGAHVQRLMAVLSQSAAWGAPPEIDILCHSRGGLVVRSLLEEGRTEPMLLKQVRKVIFVATPNGGTNLARAQNWGHLVGAFSRLTWLTWVTSHVTELLHLLSRDGLEEWPGVQAMVPNGEWLTTHLYGRTRPAHIRYYAMSSNYEPEEWLSFKTPKNLLFDEVFQVANDLVVDTESVTGQVWVPQEERRIGEPIALAGAAFITDGANQEVLDLVARLQREKQAPELLLLREVKGVDHSGYFRTALFREFVSQVLLSD